MIYLLQEYAGFGGNAQFFKHDVEFQANKSLSLNTVSIKSTIFVSQCKLQFLYKTMPQSLC